MSNQRSLQEQIHCSVPVCADRAVVHNLCVRCLLLVAKVSIAAADLVAT
jgi:hypothetical protein